MIPSNEMLAMAELSADMVFGKIPKEKYLYYINASLKVGTDAATEYKGKTPQELYDDFAAKIVMEKEAVRCGGVELRAQTITKKGKTTVHIYRESIHNLVANSAWEDVGNLDLETAVNIHLYHELFHVMEEKKHAYVSDMLDGVTIWKVLSFSGSSHVVRCSEIAAHSFAKEMAGLPWLPNFYDYIYLRNQKKLSESQFNDFFVRMQDLLEEGKRGKRNAGDRI